MNKALSCAPASPYSIVATKATTVCFYRFSGAERQETPMLFEIEKKIGRFSRTMYGTKDLM